VLAPREPASDEALIQKNLARFSEMTAALEARDLTKIQEIESSLSKQIVRGVNICPPADYKPAHDDRYCVRCEGFAECSVRYLNAGSKAAGLIESASPQT